MAKSGDYTQNGDWQPDFGACHGQHGRLGLTVRCPVHEVLPVAETGQCETFVQHLRRHERRETTYLEMSRGLAKSGIEKWTVDTGRMTMTFYDKADREMLAEQIS